jgi:hypothetical protein
MKRIRFKMRLKPFQGFRVKGSSINDVTALGGRGYQGFCDDINKALVLQKCDDGVLKISNIA